MTPFRPSVFQRIRLAVWLAYKALRGQTVELEVNDGDFINGFVAVLRYRDDA